MDQADSGWRRRAASYVSSHGYWEAGGGVSRRAPRLVVNSSVSGVTSTLHTSLPNRSANPTLADVFLSMPLSDSRESLVALVLDVAKAHRRVLIRACDRGLLCFRHRQKLYQCIALNFGARVSSYLLGPGGRSSGSPDSPVDPGPSFRSDLR